MDGSHVYEPPVLPLGAETTTSYNAMIHAKSTWAEKLQKMPKDFTPEYALPKEAPEESQFHHQSRHNHCARHRSIAQL